MDKTSLEKSPLQKIPPLENLPSQNISVYFPKSNTKCRHYTYFTTYNLFPGICRAVSSPKA
jgi:hypothetical protein